MHAELPVVYLKAGEMHFTDEPSVVITVLGSCLSVTMHSRRMGIGGICHGLLPECEGKKACSSGCREGLRYVECSILQMLRLFEKAGAKRSEIDVMCFGGADMFSRKIQKPGLVSVGRQNIMTAEVILRREGLTIKKQDVGGLGGRKIYFYTQNGEVLLKRLTRKAAQPSAGSSAAGAPCR
jgi:chemotaxis protein CheD